VANAGDCRCVVHHREEDASQVTTDHSPTLPHETKRIEKAGGIVKYGRIEERLSVSRGFGTTMNFSTFPLGLFWAYFICRRSKV